MSQISHDPHEMDDPEAILEAIRQMRMAALYPRREALEAWILEAKELIEKIPEGPRWQMAAGYLNGMIAMYNRRFGGDVEANSGPWV